MRANSLTLYNVYKGAKSQAGQVLSRSRAQIRFVSLSLIGRPIGNHLFANGMANSADPLKSEYYFGEFFGFLGKCSERLSLAKLSHNFAYLCFEKVKMY